VLGLRDDGQPDVRAGRVVSARFPATVASISKANGAYRIDYFHTDLTDDLGSHEMTDVASSRVAAKRIARAAALDLGYVGPFRWNGDYLEASIEEVGS